VRHQKIIVGQTAVRPDSDSKMGGSESEKTPGKPGAGKEANGKGQNLRRVVANGVRKKQIG